MTRTPAKRSSSRSLGDLAPDEVKAVVDQFTGLHGASLEQRKERYRSLANDYYTLVTDFYEFGWGRHLHFASRRRGESFQASLLRHERYLADQLSLKPGMQVLDVGCGIGGPMGTLARQYGASFVGINNNAYQIERAKVHTRDVQSLCRFIHGDYMQIPEGDDHYDAAIAIESTCYAPDKTRAFQEIFRVLRPGACFAGYECCLTEEFDPRNAEHLRIKKDIVTTSGLPDHRPHFGGLRRIARGRIRTSGSPRPRPRLASEDALVPRFAGSRSQSHEYSAHTCWPRLDQCGVTGWGEVTGGSGGHHRGQHAVK